MAVCDETYRNSGAVDLDPEAVPPAALGAPLVASDRGLEWMSGWRGMDKRKSQRYGQELSKALAPVYARVTKAVEDHTVDNLTFASVNGNVETDLLAALTKALLDARNAVKAGNLNYGVVDKGDSGYPIGEKTLRRLNNEFPDKVKKILDQKKEVAIGGVKFPAVTVSYDPKNNWYFFKYPEIDRAKLTKAIEIDVRKILKLIQSGDRSEAYHCIVSLVYGMQNLQLFVKGSSSLGEMLMRTLFHAMKMDVGVIKKGNGFDLNAWIEGPEDYRRNFPSLFVGADAGDPSNRYPWED